MPENCRVCNLSGLVCRAVRGAGRQKCCTTRGRHDHRAAAGSGAAPCTGACWPQLPVRGRVLQAETRGTTLHAQRAMKALRHVGQRAAVPGLLTQRVCTMPAAGGDGAGRALQGAAAEAARLHGARVGAERRAPVRAALCLLRAARGRHPGHRLLLRLSGHARAGLQALLAVLCVR